MTNVAVPQERLRPAALLRAVDGTISEEDANRPSTASSARTMNCAGVHANYVSILHGRLTLGEGRTIAQARAR